MQGKVQIATCAQTIPQKAKPVILHQRGRHEALRHLIGPNYQEAETKPFAPADLKTLARLDDAVIQVTNFVFVKDLLIHPRVDRKS